MSLRISAPSLLCAAAIVALPDAAVRGESGQAPDVPPPKALDVAADLVRQSVTAGVAMCWPRGERQASGDAVPAIEPDLAACDELNASLFQRREGGVLHIRTTREPRRVTELLNRSIHIEAVSDVQAIDAVMRIILKAVRGNGSAGEISSISAQSWPVTLRGGRTTFMEALDDVVRRRRVSSGCSPSRRGRAAATL